MTFCAVMTFCSVMTFCAVMTFLCRYDLLALTLTLLWLIAGTKFVLGLYDRINYVMHRPNNDVRTLILKSIVAK